MHNALAELQREVNILRKRIAALEGSSPAVPPEPPLAQSASPPHMVRAEPPASPDTAASPAPAEPFARELDAGPAPGSAPAGATRDYATGAPAADIAFALPGWMRRFVGANTLVRTGVLVMFGVAFLLKWVSERVTFPIEARLFVAAL